MRGTPAGARRWSALLVLKMASLTLRGAMACSLSGRPLRTALSLASLLETAGALLLGMRRRSRRTFCDDD